MKVGKTSLKTSSGKILHFKSEEARDRYEKYNMALKHGWKPTRKK